MWRWLVGVICFAGCGPEFAVVPSGGLAQATSQLNGATMTALADQWQGNPYDLADYVTPIAVELYNAGPYEVRVSFVDLALRDESGHRYAAVSPFTPNTLGAILPCPERGFGCDDDGGPRRLPDGKLVLLAGRSGGGGRSVGAPSGVRSAAPAMRSGGARGYQGGARGRFGWGVRGGFYGGYRVHGGYRRWYGPGLSYWSGPAWPLVASPWVVLWGPAYYPAPPSQDVLLSALPEGVLPPGASVAGFIYFQRATSSATHHLDLSWNLHDAQNNADMGTTHVPLDVVPR